MAERAPPGALADAVVTAARAGEADRYVAALLAPAPLAPGLVVLAALAAEIGRIPAQVREPMMGEIRLQWWHDAILGAGEPGPTGNPIADAARSLVLDRGLDKAPIQALIDARLTEISRELLADDAAVMRHLDATEGSCFRIALQLAGLEDDNQRAGLATAAGRAYGLARRLGQLPYHLARGGFPIPTTRLAEQGLALERLIVRPVPPEVRHGIATTAAALRAIGRQELALVRAAIATATPDVRAALLPLAMVEPYFAAQERRQVLALEQPADVTPLGRFWRLWRSSHGQPL